MWIPIAKAAGDIPDHGLACEAQGEHVALFRIGGCLYATSNVCTHQFALLTEGFVEGEFIECPMHQGRFHIPSGAAQGVPVTKPVRTFQVRVEGDEVQIDYVEATA